MYHTINVSTLLSSLGWQIRWSPMNSTFIFQTHMSKQTNKPIGLEVWTQAHGLDPRAAPANGGDRPTNPFLRNLLRAAPFHPRPPCGRPARAAFSASKGSGTESLTFVPRTASNGQFMTYNVNTESQ